MKSRVDVKGQAGLDGLKRELEAMLPRVQKVMRQTRARVLGGDTHVKHKLVSLFEPPTEITRKGKAGKPTEFGKLVKIQKAEQQIIIDHEVYAERPSDNTLLVPAIEVHERRLGRVPDVAQPPSRGSTRPRGAAAAEGSPEAQAVRSPARDVSAPGHALARLAPDTFSVGLRFWSPATR